MVPDSIERELILKHPVEKVWAALTTAEGLAGWFGSSAEIDLRQGGRVFLRWEEQDMDAEATVVTVEPPHRFAFRWPINGLPKEDPRRTLVEFTLSEIEEGTRLSVVETGFAQLEGEAHEKAHGGNIEGWTAELADLVAYLDA